MKLVANWKLHGGVNDSTGSAHGKAHNVQYVAGIDGESDGAALFNGIDSGIEVINPGTCLTGTNEFSISMWVNTNEKFTGVYGDILQKYDTQSRRGLNLWISGSSSAYCSPGNSRNVHFGIDDSIAMSWTDCGKPCETNTLISTLATYQGELYAGIADALDSKDACHVYKYKGSGKWEDCGRLGNDMLSLTIRSMIVHDGKLYGGTGVWDWTKANEGIGGPCHVYCYEGGTTWRDCGQMGSGNTVNALASYNGKLYMGDNNGECFCYDGDDNWIYCGGVLRLDPESLYQDRIDSMMVHQGKLYCGNAGGNGFFYRYEGGTVWTCLSRNPYHTAQMHSMQTFGGNLYLGTWPTGKVLRYDGNWICETGQVGISTEKFQINEINDFAAYNGKLYAGVIPKAELYRYDGDWNWTLVHRLVNNPEWAAEDISSWCRVPCVNIFNGKLYCGTSTCEGIAAEHSHYQVGRVMAFEAGKCVSFDDDLGSDWKHIPSFERGNV